jgi:hypothetical protein
MKKSFPGYYRPTEAEYDQLWAESIFALDANVLLDFYRSTEETQASFLGILESIKSRLWLPYQVAKEFHERKLDVVWSAQRAYVEVRSAAEAVVNKFQSALESYKKHPRIEADELLRPFQTALLAIIKELENSEKMHPDVVRKDDIGEKIASLFDGKIGKPYTNEELEKRCKRAETRYGAQVPPGYKDHKKEGARKYGDAILWFQLLEHAQKEKKSIIFVTADLKDDWWLQHEGKIISPCPELIQEMWEVAQVRFRMYRPTEFVKYAQKHLNLKGGGSLDRAVNELNEIEKEKRSEGAAYRAAQKIIGDDTQATLESESWADWFPSRAERDLGWIPHPNMLNRWQSRLHEILPIEEAIKTAGRALVGFGPWVCECRRVLVALGNLSSGPTFVADNQIICLCGRSHSIPATLYKAFVFEDGWRELQRGTILS